MQHGVLDMYIPQSSDQDWSCDINISGTKFYFDQN